MTIKKSFSQLLILALVVSVTACGFHLRGQIPIPANLKNLYLDIATASFKQSVSDVMTNSGATILPAAGGADATVRVTRFFVDREVSTIDNRGKANSYKLVMQVNYELVSPKGTVARNASLREERAYDYDPLLVLETEAEEAKLLDSMEQDIALQIARQLSVMINYNPDE